MASRAALIVALAALWAGVLASAQSAPQAPPVFRARADLVEVDVVVHGKDGAFVGDLSLGDFIVEENGRIQPIEQFYIHRGGENGIRAAAAANGNAFDTPRSAAAPRVFVVVFDDEHLTAGGFKLTQAAAQSLFAQHFRAGDVGGVVSRGRMTKDRLTTDREELLQAVKNAKPSGAKNSRLFDEQQWPRLTEIEAVRIAFNHDPVVLAEVVRRACNDDPELCRRIDPEPSVRGKASQMAQTARSESAATLRTLTTLMTGLAAMPGRKTILLMSEGFLAEDEWPQVKETVALAARANARVYTLDGRGLNRGLRSIYDAPPTGNDSGMRLLEQMDFGGDSINSLAVDSGGFVVRNTNQFDAAVARIADDSANYYVLGVKADSIRDGKFHPISVKVKRAGLAVRARRGYVALPSAPVTTETAAPPVPEKSGIVGGAPAGAVGNVGTPAEPTTVEGTVVPRQEHSSGLRLRPGADSHADALAGGNRAHDPDAMAGWDAYQRGDVETARTRLSAAAARSGDAWVHYTLGMSNYALGRYRDAVASWERVRSSVPDFEPVYFDLVDGYLQQKDHDPAIRVARAGIERWPADPELLNALGVVQTSRGALDDAVKSFQSAIAVAPADSTAYFNLAKALELRYARSRRYVQQLRAWVAHEADRESAIQNYERYLEMGGVYADSARAGLTRLKWLPAK